MATDAINSPALDLTVAHLTRRPALPMHDWHVRWTLYLEGIIDGGISCTAKEEHNAAALWDAAITEHMARAWARESPAAELERCWEVELSLKGRRDTAG